MISSVDYQTIMCELDRAIVSGSETVNQLIEASTILQNGGSISATRRQTFAGEIVTAAESLHLFDSTFNEIKNFINTLNTYVVEKTGSLNSFLVSNNIIVPQNVADLSASAGFTIPSSQIGICSNSASSSSSSATLGIVDSVIRLSNTDYAWQFTKSFSNNSFSLEDIAGLVLGNSTLPTAVLSITSPIIILQYPSNTNTTWKTVPPVYITFTDGTDIDISNGSID